MDYIAKVTPEEYIQLCIKKVAKEFFPNGNPAFWSDQDVIQCMADDFCLLQQRYQSAMKERDKIIEEFVPK